MKRLILLALVLAASVRADDLPSWNDGAAKQALVAFVKDTTTQGSAKFVPPEERIAVFDQDGTTWVEQPMYAQVMYCLHRVGALAEKDPKLIGRWPHVAFGNSDGDREMLEERLGRRQHEERLEADFCVR